MSVLGPVFWKPFLVKTSQRKTGKSSSTSSSEEGPSPKDKRIRCNASLTDSETNSEADEGISILNMAEKVMPTLQLLLEKLENVELKDQKPQATKLITVTACSFFILRLSGFPRNTITYPEMILVFMAFGLAQ